ncbi:MULTISPECIES: DUF4333 domain-containing protein [Prauserella salsuginis group]|uniref:DUF4333 domain-containing protein n=1 Tax=Prauserella salsuginis TaxID=387889 RepID=A0ABW6G4C2_9PSEU|nr:MULTISPECIES: DUF4333 domain-containing protein [Prauserella salsuginis group]MCR3718200.1 protein of unknown function (DUF4333) [Prauserella flava]MCR3732770.1 protein of unknown function (DUF4333) [Prauserella salsuginis]
MGRRPLAVLAGIVCLGLLTACNQSAGDEESGSGTGSDAEPTSAATTESTDDGATGSSPVPSPTETVRFFDVNRMNADVRRVVAEDYGLEQVREVSCPRNEPVEVGASFTCYIELAAGERTVTITVQNEQGRYRVGAPE